ncbi:MAG: aquaporin, partial [Bacteroidetes bacterium]
MKSSKKYFSEGLGTFALVLIGCAAATVSGISETGTSGIWFLGIALAFGLAVAAMVYTIRFKNIN